MQIYIKDTTLNPIQYVTLNSYPELIQYLERLVHEVYGKYRSSFMEEMAALGYGYDDSSSVNFLRLMSDRYEMGIIRDGVRIKCDVSATFVFNREEYGN